LVAGETDGFLTGRDVPDLTEAAYSSTEGGRLEGLHACRKSDLDLAELLRDRLREELSSHKQRRLRLSPSVLEPPLLQVAMSDNWRGR